jgi:hypothetical protein
MKALLFYHRKNHLTFVRFSSTKCISHKGGSALRRVGTFGKPHATGDVNAPEPLTAHTLERYPT